MPSPTNHSREATLIDILSLRAEATPHRRAYTFRTSLETASGSSEDSRNDASLRDRALSIAAAMQPRTKPGQRNLLVYPAGPEFLVAFLGCLALRAIAVPVALPNRASRFDRLTHVASDCDAQALWMTRGVLDTLPEDSPLRRLDLVTTDDLPTEQKLSESQRPELDDIAYLQYTSGSTSTPSGVRISHRNLVANLRYIAHAFELSSQSVSVSWLPHFHDMGLVDGYLEPLFSGFHGVVLSPSTFAKDPSSWLKAITEHKGTHGGGPNFAYDLCVRQVSPVVRETLDLSSWRSAYNGAEPIHARTLDLFAKTFDSCGFRRTALYPCYGLAESTLMVTGGSVVEEPITLEIDADSLEAGRAVDAKDGERARTVTSSGRVHLDTEVRIVSPQTGQLCEENEIGEIWVRSPSISLGYWQQDEKSQKTFGGKLPGSDGAYLRTGDLGFFRGAELFVTGRLKDLLILRGRNYYPHDLEAVVQRSHTAVEGRAGAAISIDTDHGESLGIVQEVHREWRKRDLSGVIESIREAVHDEFDLTCARILLLKPSSVPMTSSGKIRRAECRRRTMESEWVPLAEWCEASNEVPHDEDDGLLRVVLEQLAIVMGKTSVEANRDTKLFELGLDSLHRVQWAAALERALGIDIEPEEFGRLRSVDEVLRLCQVKKG